MEITGQLPMTRARYGRMVRMVQGRLLVAMLVVGVFCIAVGVWGFVRGSTPGISQTGLIAGGAVMLLFPWLLIGLPARKLRLRDEPVWTYRLTPTEVTQSNPVADLSVRWDRVARCKEAADAWALKLAAGGWLVLLKEAFDPADLPRVAELVATAGQPRSTT